MGMEKHVLVVDDNPLNLELVGDLLELEGFRVTLLEDGVTAISEARDSRPDLILMDLRMPGMSGLEAQQQLRSDATTREIPVIVLTASVMAGERERLLAAGFDGFMQKPIDTLTFADQVRGFLPTA